MKQFSLKIGGIKEMLSKDQMKKISGGYMGCEYNSVIGADACRLDWDGVPLTGQNNRISVRNCGSQC